MTTKTTKTNKTAKPTLCQCGCGEPVAANRTYRQGHDARFYGRCIKVVDGRLTMKDLKAAIGSYALKFYKAEIACYA